MHQQTFVVTVFRTEGTTMQRYNAANIIDAIRIMNDTAKTRFARKVELSVIIHAIDCERLTR